MTRIISDNNIPYPKNWELTPASKDQGVWAAVKGIFSNLLSPVTSSVNYLISKCIHPASFCLYRLWCSKEIKEGRKALYRFNDHERYGEICSEVQQHTIKTPDGVTLDGMFFKNPNNPDKVVIYCPGNNRYFELEQPMIELLLKMGFSVFTFNPRDVGRSNGDVSVKGFGLDTYSVAKHLQNEGIQAENMVFYGHSLGGYRATAGAALFQRENEAPINVINDRSFSSIREAVRALIGSVSALVISFFGWEMDAEKEWKAIKSNCDGSNRILVHHPYDTIIRYPAQLINKLRQKIGFQEVKLDSDKSLETRYELAGAHRRYYKPEEMLQIFAPMAKLLEIKNSHFSENEPIPSPVIIEYPEGCKPTLIDKVKHIAWKCFSYLIFPIGCINYLIAKLICPASFWLHRYQQRNEIKAGKEYLEKNLHGQKESIVTPDGVKLDGMFFENRANPKKVIIFCGGNGVFYEWCDYKVKAMLNKGYSVFLFNPRGVSDSTGEISETGFALDTYSVAEYLSQKQGIDHEDMLFYGHSLGGFRATAGVALLQKKYPGKSLKIISDRSFSNMKLEVEALVGRIAAKLVDLFGWKFDAKKYWEQINATGKNKIVVYHPDDQVIPLPAQLNSALAQDGGKEIRVKLEPYIINGKEKNPHNRHLTCDEDKEVFSVVNELMDPSLMPKEGDNFDESQIIQWEKKDRPALDEWVIA